MSKLKLIQLNDLNYLEWSKNMRTVLTAKGLVHTIEHKTPYEYRLAAYTKMFPFEVDQDGNDNTDIVKKKNQR